MSALVVWNDSIDHDGAMAGTLTCVARAADDAQRFYAIAAAHVLAPLVGAAAVRGPLPGDRVCCRLDEGADPREIGALAYWPDLQPRSSGFANRMDVAMVDIDRDTARLLRQRLQQPDALADEVSGMSVRFDGRTSGSSAGTVAPGRVSPVALYGMLGGGFAEVQLVDVVAAQMRAGSGDSGALVVSDAGAVGMLLTANDAGGSGFCRLRPMFEALNLAWIDGPASAAAAAVAEGAPGADLFQPDVEAAVDTLARTLWGEARGEPPAGQRAVAAVVLKRAGHPRVHWWGSDVAGVCRRPMQFSCWNEDDPNRVKLLALSADNAPFRQCLQVARAAAAGQLGAECAMGATHYHTRSILPKWARGKRPCAEIGNHVFYNDIEG